MILESVSPPMYYLPVLNLKLFFDFITKSKSDAKETVMLSLSNEH